MFEYKYLEFLRQVSFVRYFSRYFDTEARERILNKHERKKKINIKATTTTEQSKPQMSDGDGGSLPVSDYDDEEFSNVIEGLDLQSPGDSGNPIEVASDEEVHGELVPVVAVGAAGGNAQPNVFPWVSVFAVTTVHTIISTFHEFRVACTSFDVFKVFTVTNSTKPLKLFNISSSSNVYIDFLQVLYEQFRQNAINYMARDGDHFHALNAGGYALILRARFRRFYDFVFKKDMYSFGNGTPNLQCLSCNFRNHILVPVLHAKYNIAPTRSFPAHFGVGPGGVQAQDGFFTFQRPGGAEFLELGN